MGRIGSTNTKSVRHLYITPHKLVNPCLSHNSATDGAPASPNGNGSSSSTQATTAALIPMTPEARWERLQKTYRLAALRIRKVQVEQYRVDIDKQRIAVARRMKEDRSCVVCLDKAPNTVINHPFLFSRCCRISILLSTS
jgi:hypothetical protein